MEEKIEEIEAKEQVPEQSSEIDGLEESNSFFRPTSYPRHSDQVNQSVVVNIDGDKIVNKGAGATKQQFSGPILSMTVSGDEVAFNMITPDNDIFVQTPIGLIYDCPSNYKYLSECTLVDQADRYLINLSNGSVGFPFDRK